MSAENNLFGVPKFDTLEIIMTGSVSVTKAASDYQETSTLTHGLGYVPILLAFAQNSDDTTGTWLAVPYADLVTSGASSGLLVYQLDVLMNTQELRFRITATDVTGGYNTAITCTFTYFIYRAKSGV